MSQIDVAWPYPNKQRALLRSAVPVPFAWTETSVDCAGTSRQLARSAAGVGTDVAVADDFGRDDEGKMIIKVLVTGCGALQLVGAAHS